MHRSIEDNRQKKGSSKHAKLVTRQKASKNEKEIVREVSDLIEPLCESSGMELVHTEYRREAGGRILRLYIDKPGGVSLEDCTNISREAGDILDVYLENVGPYSLEVSSPGIERPISKKADFQKFIGSTVCIKTGRSLDGKKNFKGILSGVNDQTVSIKTGEILAEIPFEDITRANLAEK